MTPRVVNEAAVPTVLEKAVDGFIRPGYLDLMETTAALSEASHLFCEEPSEESLGNLKLVFDDTVQKWSTIEIVRVGIHSTLIEADGDRLDQAFLNLLENAIRHTPAGTEVDVAVSERDLEAADRIRRKLKDMLCDRFDVAHATLEMEFAQDVRHDRSLIQQE